MLLEKRQVFFLKGPPLVVLPLVLHIVNNFPKVRSANAERSVSILPGKEAQIWELLMDPLGGLTLEKLNNLAR